MAGGARAEMSGYHPAERAIRPAREQDAQPDFAQLARARGCYGEHVERTEEVHGAIERALWANEEGQPAVVAFLVDGGEFAEGFHAYYALKDG